MAMNLRLGVLAEQALRQEAVRTGRSQQSIIREAVEQHLGLSKPTPPGTQSAVLVAVAGALPARTPFRELEDLVSLPERLSVAHLLDREERV